MTSRLAGLAALLLTTASPAFAQNLCGTGSSGIWIGGDQAGSDISTAPAALDQLALVLAGNGYVSVFDVSSTTDVRIEAEGNGDGDPVIDLLSSTGGALGSDDDGGGGTSSRLETTLDPGIYCAVLSSFGGAPMTGTIRIGRTDHEALTTGTPDSGNGSVLPDPSIGPGCGSGFTLADGTLDGILPGTTTVEASVEQVSGYDFSISSPMTMTITAENEDADPVLVLRDANGQTIAENDDFDGLNSRLDITQPLPAGDYCLELQALSDTSEPILVTVSDYDPDAASLLAYDRVDDVPPLDGSYPVELLGEVKTRLRSDVNMIPGKAKWFALQVNEGGLLLVEAIAPNDGDPVLTMFDDLGREVGYNDDAGAGLDSTMAVRVLPGTYLIALTDLNDAGQLMRVVIERYVPAR